MPMRAAPLEAFITSSVEGFSDYIEACLGHRPVIRRVTIVRKREDKHTGWLGVRTTSHAWDVEFKGQERRWGQLWQATNWIWRIAA